MQGSVNDYVSRLAHARADFARTLVELGGIEQSKADKLVDWYVSHRLAKVDANIGRINVKHGLYLDRDVIQRAAMQV
jgi:hypothetical protein